MLAFCVGIVLLIACFSSVMVNMQFARATLRAKELAIRSSLGATRSRLICQMLTESLLLSTIGAIVGITALAVLERPTGSSAAIRNSTQPPPSWMVVTRRRPRSSPSSSPYDDRRAASPACSPRSMASRASAAPKSSRNPAAATPGVSLVS